MLKWFKKSLLQKQRVHFMALAVITGLLLSGANRLQAAGVSDALTISITPEDTSPPTAVSDLIAATSLTEGEILLSWTSPSEDSFVSPSLTPVTLYHIRGSTQSAAQVGNATLWWNGISDLGTPPGPLIPGSPQSVLLSGLIPGATYWFGLRSEDEGGLLSPLDTNTQSLVSQIQGVAPDLPPPAPATLSAVLNGLETQLVWSTVTASDFWIYQVEVDNTAPYDFTDLYVATQTTSDNYHHQGLGYNTTYAYRVVALDQGSPLALGQVLRSTPTPVAQVTTPLPESLRPAPVAGYNVFNSLPNLFNFNWSEVTHNEDGTVANDLSGYRLYRSTALSGPFNVMVSSASGISTTSLNVLASASQNDYFLVVAVDALGNESSQVTSNLIHVTPQGIVGQVGLSDDGSLSRVYVPEAHMAELKVNGTDHLVHVERVSHPRWDSDTRRTLRTYAVTMKDPVGQSVSGNHVLSAPAMQVTLQYEAAGVTGVTGPQESIGVLWWNGNRWIKSGQGRLDTTLNTVSFETALPGLYQVRRFVTATNLTLDKSNIFPRIFSPNGDGVNDLVYFVIENPNNVRVEGQIIDMTGGSIAILKPSPGGIPTPETLVWDGKDKNGGSVPAGPYLFKVQGEGKTITGVVVIAK